MHKRTRRRVARVKSFRRIGPFVSIRVSTEIEVLQGQFHSPDRTPLGISALVVFARSPYYSPFEAALSIHWRELRRDTLAGRTSDHLVQATLTAVCVSQAAVFQKSGTSAVYFTTKMAIDADGAPKAIQESGIPQTTTTASIG